jgi:isoquinoline 1-oxidoreductase subunit beta
MKTLNVRRESEQGEAMQRLYRNSVPPDPGLSAHGNLCENVAPGLEGGIIYGLTAALYGKTTLKDGHIEQSNFDNYQALRINEAPAIEVHLVENREDPGGIGELGTPAIAPAVVNAVIALTGKCLRKLPIDTDQLKSAHR